MGFGICYKKLPKMSGQKKISSFFSPRQRYSEDKNTEGNSETLAKRAKLDLSPDKENIQATGDHAGIELSPEQKQRMEENRLKAEEKVRGRQSQGLLVNVGESWRKALEPQFSKTYFTELSKFVDTERKKYTVYPTAENVFSWTRACPVDKVKVVILGQDPYHGPNQAHGLSFSVLPGVPPPPSLGNMFRELEQDIEGFKRPGHGYLLGWANQGVLMLNAVLTVRAGQANSHKDKGWEKLTDAVISYLNQNREGIVFILWGAYAQKKGAHINKSKHHVLKGVHPSPLSAHRGFMGCAHFSQCNNLLTNAGHAPIDWSHLPVDSH